MPVFGCLSSLFICFLKCLQGVDEPTAGTPAASAVAVGGGRRVRVEPREEGGHTVRGAILHTASVRERLEVPVSVCVMRPRRPFSWKACSRGLRFISALAWSEQRLCTRRG